MPELWLKKHEVWFITCIISPVDTSSQMVERTNLQLPPSGLFESVRCATGGSEGLSFQALLAQYVKRMHTPHSALTASEECSQVLGSAADTIASAAELPTLLTAALKGSSSCGLEEMTVAKQIQLVSEVGSQSPHYVLSSCTGF